MASVDESRGNSGGTIAFMMGERDTFARLAPQEIHPAWYQHMFLTETNAAACRLGGTFSSCTNNVITRTLGGCTVGSAAFTGSVTLTWNDATVDNTCFMASTGHYVTGDPNFTVTGLRGATLALSKSGTVGQKLERTATAGTYTFTNDGIHRKFTTAAGVVAFDFTSKLTSGITVTGASRASRVVSGGAIEVKNNLSGTTCTVVPTALTWDGTCNCAVSGAWAGTCTDGKTYSLSLTGCGTGSFTLGTDTNTVNFDRCEST